MRIALAVIVSVVAYFGVIFLMGFAHEFAGQPKLRATLVVGCLTLGIMAAAAGLALAAVVLWRWAL